MIFLEDNVTFHILWEGDKDDEDEEDKEGGRGMKRMIHHWVEWLSWLLRRELEGRFGKWLPVTKTLEISFLGWVISLVLRLHSKGKEMAAGEAALAEAENDVQSPSSACINQRNAF
jgi:hypothetical protein